MNKNEEEKNIPWLRGLDCTGWKYLDIKGDCKDYCTIFFESVIKDTITRYSGFNDCIDNPIYEGDNISYNSSIKVGKEKIHLGVVELSNGSFIVRFNGHGPSYLVGYKIEDYKSKDNKLHLKIIGNIYEGSHKEANYIKE